MISILWGARIVENDRRTFIKAASITAAGVVAIGGAAKLVADTSTIEPLGALTIHTLPALPYAYDALEPFIDKETMTIHHSMHHKAYVDGLNKAEKELALARSKGDFSLIEYWSKKAAFNGGGHFLHSLFWENMAPAHSSNVSALGGKEPEGALRKKISEDFGSLESFKKQFTAAAVAVEGSGWAMLHHRPQDNRLIVLQGENQHKLTSWGATPILVLDVWEHAYYLKYQNKRAAYVEAWWNVVNWDVVSKRFSKHSS